MVIQIYKMARNFKQKKQVNHILLPVNLFFVIYFQEFLLEISIKRYCAFTYR